MNKKSNENILKVDFLFGLLVIIAIPFIGYIFFDDLKSFFITQSEKGRVCGEAFFLKTLTTGVVFTLSFMGFLYAKLKEKRQERYMKGFTFISFLSLTFFVLTLTFSQLLFYLFDVVDFDVMIFMVLLVGVFIFFAALTRSLMHLADLLRKNVEVNKWSLKDVLVKNSYLFLIFAVLVNFLSLVGDRNLYLEIIMLDIGLLLAFFAGVILPVRLAKIFSKILN
jgi:hypothetical protein